MADEIKTGTDTGGGVATEPEPTAEPTTPEPSEPEGDKAPTTPSPAAPAAIKLPASIKPPVKPTGRFQGRISDLVSQRNAATAEADRLRQQVSRMQSIPRAGEKAAEGATAPAGGGTTLNPEDFATYGEYVQALAERVWEEKEAAKTSKQNEEAYKNYQTKKQAEFQEHSQIVADQFPGYWDAITDESLPISEAMADAVIELDELGPMTMLYLASNRGEAAKISKMNPRLATIAIGRIAAKLDQDIKAGNLTGSSLEPEIGNTNDNVNGATPTGTPTIKPSPVPVPRGSTPALQGSPSDKDDVNTWLRKETERMRKIYPHGRFYGA